jgi:hypothetical protein
MVEKVHKFNSHCPSVYFGIGKEENPMRVGKKKVSYLQNTFLFSFIWILLTFKAHNFLISFSF